MMYAMRRKSDEKTERQLSVHPAEQLGVDPFEFCHFGRPGRVPDHPSGPTLVDRVIHFVDRYKHV
jgi:hypothetical protein